MEEIDIITEENLREIYGIEVSIFSGRDGMRGDEMKYCMPALDSAEVVASRLDNPSELPRVAQLRGTM